jgi:cytochrome P450
VLSTYPEIERRLHAELATVLGDRLPTAEDLSRLAYMRKVIAEVLRLFPSTWANSRDAVEDDEIGGYQIPGGSLVVFSPYVTHRDPRFWENPAGFDPERFTPERIAARPRYAYFPFAGGPRLCIGYEFAVMEATLAVTTIAQQYRLHLVPGHRSEPYLLHTLRPRHGVLMTLARRSRANGQAVDRESPSEAAASSVAAALPECSVHSPTDAALSASDARANVQS